MLGALRAWFIPTPPAEVEATYIALVEAARNPFFYTALQVPDSIDGRFDMIVLHLFLLQHKLLEDANQATEFSQLLSEAFFRDLDRNLREMGVADTGVSHRIKKMGKAYHGRLQVYSAATGNHQAMCAALARNLYGTLKEGDVAVLSRMAQYIEKTQQKLQQTPLETVLAAQFKWPDPSIG